MKIESYSFGKMTVPGRTLIRDCQLFHETIVENWRRQQGHFLAMNDLETSLAVTRPRVIVVGTGYFGMMQVAPELIAVMQDRGIRLIVQKTTKAWKTYNEMYDQENVLGVFHLTC